MGTKTVGLAVVPASPNSAGGGINAPRGADAASTTLSPWGAEPSAQGATKVSPRATSPTPIVRKTSGVEGNVPSPWEACQAASSAGINRTETDSALSWIEAADRLAPDFPSG